MNNLYNIKSIVEKPSPSRAKSNLGVVGRYILPENIFEKIKKSKPGVGKEIQITDAISDLLCDQDIYGYVFEGKRFDCGSKLGYLKATTEYAMEHKELSRDFKNYLKRLNKIISDSGARMAGWEDVLLTHSKKGQSEIEVNENLLDLDFIPSVWNNTWGEGREDIIYKLNNLGFQTIMSNSAAFYFDMTDDMDMENSGLSWSGYVNSVSYTHLTLPTKA